MLDILGLIIGIVFAFLLLSLLATILQETISSLLSMRGKFLLDALIQLLELDWVDDSELADTPEGEKVKARLQKRKAKRAEWNEKIKSTRVYQKFVHSNAGIKRLPSYLSSEQVISILQELLTVDAPEEEQVSELAQVQAVPGQTIQVQRSRGAGGAASGKISKVAPEEEEEEQGEEAQKVDAIDLGLQKNSAFGHMRNYELRDNLNMLRSMTIVQKYAPPADVSQMRTPSRARGIIEDASKRYDQIKLEISRDFDQMMDRTAEWYKKRVQTVLFIIGMVVAIGLNADTFNMYQALSNNPEARKEVLAIAENFVNNSRFDYYQDSVVTRQDTTLTDQERVVELRNKMNVLLANELSGVDSALGFGWTSLPDPFPTGMAAFRFWIFKLFGWVVTALAISLGATFWFDILKQLINIRNSGIRPMTTEEKEQKK